MTMWNVSGHRVLLTGAYVDPDSDSAAFVFLCIECPDTRDDDDPSDYMQLWRISEHHPQDEPVFDYRAAFEALATHTGLTVTAEHIDAAVVMSGLDRDVRCGLGILEDSTPETTSSRAH